MKLKFEGDFDELEPGIGVIAEELHFDLSEDGIPVQVEKLAGDQIEVIYQHNRGTIR